MQTKYSTSLSAKGVVIVDAKGGNSMFTYASKLKHLGFDTCVFADDKPDELKKYKEEAAKDGIKMFLCESGNCLEQQIINDLPWLYIPRIVQCSQEGFPYLNIQLPDGFIEKMSNASGDAQNEIRSEIIKLSVRKKAEWFKHIPGGEFLGTVFCEAYKEMDDDKRLKQNMISLLKWCGVMI